MAHETHGIHKRKNNAWEDACPIFNSLLYVSFFFGLVRLLPEGFEDTLLLFLRDANAAIFNSKQQAVLLICEYSANAGGECNLSGVREFNSIANPIFQTAIPKDDDEVLS